MRPRTPRPSPFVEAAVDSTHPVRVLIYSTSMRSAGTILSGLLAVATAVSAADWPEWRGTGRQGLWPETGIIERVPADGLKVQWRVPVHAGYSGPAVARGRVLLLDHTRTTGSRVSERVVCLDE